jgi:phosphopantetheinyl transferase (holo-ACP synthase)
LGTGLNQGVYWRDMGVVNLPGGKPTMALTGGALKRLEKITPPGTAPRSTSPLPTISPGPGHCDHFGGPQLST